MLLELSLPSLNTIIANGHAVAGHIGYLLPVIIVWCNFIVR